MGPININETLTPVKFKQLSFLELRYLFLPSQVMGKKMLILYFSRAFLMISEVNS